MPRLVPPAVRLLAALTWAVWVGGFMFYGGVVVPILHDELDPLLAGGVITRRVTDALNVLGVAAILLAVGTLLLERRAGPARWLRARAVGLALSAALLAGLIVLHREMDARLDGGRLAGFYPWHRAYLAASTAQWGVNLLLGGLTLDAWSRPRGPGCLGPPVEDAGQRGR